MMRYTFTIEVEVTDVVALHEAARARWIEDQHELLGSPLSLPDISLAAEIELEGVIGTPEDPNTRACVEMMLDPGESPPGTMLGRPSTKRLV